MVEMVKIVHSNYEKISDIVFWFNSKWVMKFNVTLNKYTDKYGRINFHKEVEYNKQGNTCINITRDYSYFLTIESMQKNENGEKVSILIGFTDFYFFRQNLIKASEWFTSSQNSNIFAMKKNKIFMPRKVEPINIVVGGNVLELEPMVYDLENSEQVIGVGIYINKEDLVFIDVNRFLSLVYFIETFNMLQSAQLMINYLQRPEFGTNLYSVSGAYENNRNADNSRTSFPKKHNDGLSYFQKINKNKSTD